VAIWSRRSGRGEWLGVRVDPVAAGEHLVAVAAGVEEIQALAPGHPVPGRVGLDVHAVVRAGIGGAAQVVPVVHPEREVVQAPVRAGDHRDVVGGVRHLQPGGDLEAVIPHDLLGQPEVQYFPQEDGDGVHLLGGQEQVVQARRRNAGQVHRPGRRVGAREQVADLLHAVHQFHPVPAGQVEADGLAVPWPPLPLLEPLHLHAGGLDPTGVVVQVGSVGDLEAERVQPVGRRVDEHHRVVLVLIPALHEHAFGLAGGFNEADHLAVVSGGELQVRDPDLHVRQPQDSHQVCTFMKRSLSSPS
jgi:hypothetical protein